MGVWDAENTVSEILHTDQKFLDIFNFCEWCNKVLCDVFKKEWENGIYFY